MAGDKYLTNNNGNLQEVVATQTSAGVANAGDIPALDASGRLDTSMMPVGLGADTAVITASEALAAGDYVNVWSNASAFAVRKADASGGVAKQAHGFVLAAVASAAAATVYFEGTNTQVSGMTPGDVWLSASTPGKGVATPPTATGNIQQKVGVAVAATSVNVELGQPVILA
ncbi:conserved hypothetical protein [Pseudomonas knackmussii B13]|uniref:Uncharacterized protein n=1 Tax=Pseudomonas knackmussii (strain DSM 6978 / CCUG 54928 / LMG 23759 / B13) TaxID=1301098 RepID=A0A024HNT9_PSEKB|nr:hypothetical protein [Pseudomonas knackmussii]CDF86324.1 conserved hypothetical protein [Pseudomonas knackmussii B13]